MKSILLLIVLFLVTVLHSQTTLTIGEIFDFDINDEFHTFNDFPQGDPPNAIRMKIVDKNFSVANDTVFYTRSFNNYYSLFNPNPTPHLDYYFNVYIDTVFYTNLSDSVLCNSMDTSCVSTFEPTICDVPTNGISYLWPEIWNAMIYGKGLGLVRNYYILNGSPEESYDHKISYFKKDTLECGTPLSPPQQYIPFPPDESSEWRVDTQNWNPDPWQMTTRNKKYYFDGDSIINGNTYEKLYSTGLKTTEYSNGTTTVSSFGPWFEAGIRNQGSKVFINYFDEEMLLFDYDIQVGDTVPDCFINMESYCDLIVVSIDTIIIGNRNHKRYNFANPELINISWFIEGIGHEYGIFERACTGPDFGSTFLCYAENDEPIFPPDVVCDLTVNMKETNLGSSLIIYPNPTKNFITISATKYSIIEVSFYDLNGQRILTAKATENTIDISNLKPGLYFAEIKTSEGNVMKKIIVQ